MLRTLRAPLLRAARPLAIPHTFRRPLAVASTEAFGSPTSSSMPAMATFLDDEPKKPRILTDIPGPKARAAKEAMGKIQDVINILQLIA